MQKQEGNSDWFADIIKDDAPKSVTTPLGFVDYMDDGSTEVAKRTVAQTLMESRMFVYVYENIARPTFVRIFGGPNNNMPSMEDEFQIYADLLKLKKDEGLWLDLSCGAGFSTQKMLEASPGGRHIGLDISAAMLEGACRVLSTGGKQENLQLVRADVYEMPFKDNTFDGINNAGSLQLYPDPVGAFREIYRVLKPGGAYVASTMAQSERPLGKRFAKWTGVRRTDLSKLEDELKQIGFDDYQLIKWGDIFAFKVVKAPLQAANSAPGPDVADAAAHA